ncbi:nucleotidyltransferase [Marinifilum sp. N1E240]|uniref:nucleotidyltransferase n=1 Tax=Marinifilum sp. N1E240 TaxID=2608082 RepID=UPI00128CCE3B|nr:nucleotidyltransferase [Marinifilum sp. N1E240]MPQ49098.1 nucleotidyltransferase [Marinifilum sp. N1E240]
MLTTTVSGYNKLYKSLAKNLDISNEQFEKAISHYEAVADWLTRESSPLRIYNPDIYVQGSFSLGTVIKPLSGEDEFDIDLVCKLNLHKTHTTQERVKNKIGDRLKANSDYNRMLLEESEMCWTLEYQEDPKFFIDILPSIIDESQWLLELSVPQKLAQTAICITDKSALEYRIISENWRKSNPKGYSAWFKEQMTAQFSRRLEFLAEHRNVSIDKIKEYEVKTPLQRAVQILKRHRDIMFGSDLDKPISIIITTLAAKAYANEDNIVDALKNILLKMPLFMESINGITWVRNPINPGENFADQWEKYPTKETNFRDWISKAKIDLVNIVGTKTVNDARILLGENMGNRIVNESYRNAGIEIISESSHALTRHKSIVNFANHKEAPKWTMRLQNTIFVSARYKDENSWLTVTPETILPKNKTVVFVARTNVKKPFDVFWQVVNTGEEAKNDGQLRGSIFKATTAGAGGLRYSDHTSYTGTHWVECYVIKNNVCVARSNEIFVQIK